MSYEVQIRHTSDSGDGISVEALVEGEPVAHTFPKGRGFLEEDSNGVPYRIVNKLEKKYEEKLKREGRLTVQDTSTEEAKVQSSHYENKTFGKRESFKDEKNQIKDMSNVDTSNPEEIRDYLKENMAEGYLSEEEGLNIDKFVDEYTELLDLKQGFEEIIREVYEGQVQ